MVTHLIDESSTLVMSHFFQMMENNNFAKYDYGLFWNLKQYGHWKSPDYPLSNITSTQIALFQAENDSLADIEDIKRLKSQLKGIKKLSFGLKSRGINLKIF
jgi:lysosomal acid lipase/cholesteryl ester hydrolase